MTRRRLALRACSFVAVYLPAVGCGDGWQALECDWQLSGWSRARRVILGRGSPCLAPVGTSVMEINAAAIVPDGKSLKKKRRGKDRQGGLPHASGAGWDAQATPWSGKIAVLVCADREVSLLHEKGADIARAIQGISGEISQIRTITERWTILQRWTLLLTRLLRPWKGGK